MIFKDVRCITRAERVSGSAGLIVTLQSLPLTQQETGVDAAKTKTVRHGISQRRGTCIERHQVQIACGFIGMMEVQRRWNKLLPQRHQGEYRLNAACRTQQMAGGGFR